MIERRMDEKRARKNAQTFGVAWPCYWATVTGFTSPTTVKPQNLFITDDEIVYNDTRIKLAGAKASVDTSGNTALAQGWIWKERQDRRQLFLAIENDSAGGSLVIRMQPREEMTARQIAAEVNTRGRVAEEVR